MDREQNSFSPAPLTHSMSVCARFNHWFALNRNQRELIKWAMKQSTVPHKYMVIRSYSTLNYFKNNPAPPGLCSTSPQYPTELPFTLKPFSLVFIPLPSGFLLSYPISATSFASYYLDISPFFVSWFLYISHPKEGLLFYLLLAPLFSGIMDQPEFHICLPGQILTLGFLEQV